MTFPTPVGGTPFPNDFAPSILFAVLYGLQIPLMVHVMSHKSRRTVLLFGTIAFSIERIVIFSLRAAQSHNEHLRLKEGIITYMQVSFGMGFIGIANDLVNILRCYMVNPTYGSETFFQAPAASQGYTFLEPPAGTPDHPRQRFWFRRLADFLNIAFISATVTGVLANSHYSRVLNNQHQADVVMRYRYASTAVVLFLLFSMMGTIALTQISKTLPRASKRSALLIIYICVVLSVIAIYRLSVMFNTTTSLLSTGSNSLNKPGEKACFYIFHALPEWLATAILFSSNVRGTIGTGLCGDYRGHDETPKERRRREKRELKKAGKLQKNSNTELVSISYGKKGKDDLDAWFVLPLPFWEHPTNINYLLSE